MRFEKNGVLDGRTVSYLPTQSALAALNTIQLFGWHRCGEDYFVQYPEGIPMFFVIATVNGQGFLQTDGNRYPMSPGTVALVKPYTPVSYGTSASGVWEFYWLDCLGQGIASLIDYLLFRCSPVFATRYFPALQNKLESWFLLDRTDKQRFEWQISSDLSKIFHGLYLSQLVPSAENSRETKQVRAIVEEIEQHYGQPLNLSILSRRFYLSESTLIRQFKEATGYTPYEYLKNFRLLQSCEFLANSTIPIQEIGLAAGFSSSSNYIHQFRQRYGMTPNQYRKLFS